MKGDFSRLTFDSKKHYRAVLMQQGRVQVDADWNEQQAIDAYRDDQTFTDVIGASGVPNSVPDSFRIDLDPSSKDLTIAPGRIYVGGVLCENPSPATLLSQPDQPLTAKQLSALSGFFINGVAPQGRYLVYLDVWNRHITAVDDPAIRETALGGPDTATRLKTVWQVKLKQVGKIGQNVGCADAALPASTHDGKLTASIAPAAAATPCVLPPQTGYRRLENQLYRVEIHKPGAIGVATFKWSRENGSVVSAVLPPGGGGLTFQLDTTGRDEVLGLAHDQWVELIDDRMELADGRGQFLQIDTVDPAKRQITVKPPATPPSFDITLHPKLRVWNQTDVLTTAAAVPLEDGIQIQLTGTQFDTGDYWLIPARTAIDNTVGNIEWPQSGGNPAAVPARSIEHRYCALAIIEFDGTNFTKIAGGIPDCRNHFDDLVTLTGRKSGGGCCTVTVGPSDITATNTLQTVIDQAKGKGPLLICLKPGVYTLTATLRLDASHANLTISGCPQGVTLRAAAAGAGFQDGLIAIVNTNNIKFEKLEFQMPSAPFPSTNLASVVTASFGIRAADCDNVTVRNCAFHAAAPGNSLLFSAAIFATGTCTKWTIEENLFDDPSLNAGLPVVTGSVRVSRITSGVLIAPLALDKGTTDATGATTNMRVLKAGIADSAISRNRFSGVRAAAVIAADSGAIECTENAVRNCQNGFLFLSIQALDLMKPGQQVTVDAAYQKLVQSLISAVGAAMRDLYTYYTLLLATLYPAPAGWTAPPGSTSGRPITVRPGTSFLQVLSDRTLAVDQLARTSTAPAPPSAVNVSLNHPTAAPTAAQMITIRLSDAEISNQFLNAGFLGALAAAVEPTLSLSLDFSNNNLDVTISGEDAGVALLVFDLDKDTKSMLSMTSNRMRNFSSQSPVASLGLVDRVTVTGNLILNERATPVKAHTDVAPPYSLLVLPNIDANKDLPPFLTVTGNVLLGSSSLPQIKRPGMPVPLNDWLFANTAL